MYKYDRIEHEFDVMNEIIEDEMQRVKKRALKTISSLVHFEPGSFARILAYAYFDSVEDAIKVAESLNFSKIDFLAVMEDFDGFKEEYLMNQEEEAQNF